MNTLQITVEVAEGFDPLRIAEQFEQYLGGTQGVQAQDWALNPKPIEATLEQTEPSEIQRAARVAMLEAARRELGTEFISDQQLDECIALGFLRIAEGLQAFANGAAQFMVEASAVIEDNYETAKEQASTAGEVQPSGSTATKR